MLPENTRKEEDDNMSQRVMIQMPISQGMREVFDARPEIECERFTDLSEDNLIQHIADYDAAILGVVQDRCGHAWRVETRDAQPGDGVLVDRRILPRGRASAGDPDVALRRDHTDLGNTRGKIVSAAAPWPAISNYDHRNQDGAFRKSGGMTRTARSKSSSQGPCAVRLLVTSRKGTRRVLPKGVVEPDLSPAASAAKEALEEAGICGPIDHEPLGTYQYRKWGGTRIPS